MTAYWHKALRGNQFVVDVEWGYQNKATRFRLVSLSSDRAYVAICLQTIRPENRELVSRFDLLLLGIYHRFQLLH